MEYKSADREPKYNANIIYNVLVCYYAVAISSASIISRGHTPIRSEHRRENRWATQSSITLRRFVITKTRRWI